MFNIFINSLIKKVQQAKWFENKEQIYAYADDILFLIRGKRKLKKLIQLIEQWSRENYMEINKNKCGIFKIQQRYSVNTI